MTIIERSVGDVGTTAQDGSAEKMGFSTTYAGDDTPELRSQRVHLRTKAEAGYRVKTLPMVACTECVHVHEHGEAASTCDLVEGSVDGQHVCHFFALTESRIDQSVMHVRDWKTWDELNEGGGKAKGAVENAHTPSNHIIPAEPNNAKTTNELKYITEGETAWEAHGAANLAAHDAAEGHGGNEPSPGGGHEGNGPKFGPRQKNQPHGAAHKWSPHDESGMPGKFSAGHEPVNPSKKETVGKDTSSYTASQNAEAERAHAGPPKGRSTEGMSETEKGEREALSNRFGWEGRAVNAHQPAERNTPSKPYMPSPKAKDKDRHARFVKGYTNARHDARDRNLSAEDARAASDAHRALGTTNPETGKKVLPNPPQAERFGAAMGYKAHALEKEGKGEPAKWAQHDWSTGNPGELRRVESPFAPESEEHANFARGYHSATAKARSGSMDSEQAAARAINHHGQAQNESSATEKAFHLGSAKGFEHHAAEAPAPAPHETPEGVDADQFKAGHQEAARQIHAQGLLPEHSAGKAAEHTDRANATSGDESAHHAGMAEAFKEHAEKEPSPADKVQHEAIRHANGPAIAPEHVADYNEGVEKASRHVEDFDLSQKTASTKSEREMQAALREKDEAKRAHYLGTAAAYRAHAVHGDTDNVPAAHVIESSVEEAKPEPEHVEAPAPKPELETPTPEPEVPKVSPTAAVAPKAPPGGHNPVGTRWTHKTSGQFIVKKSDGSLRKFHEWGEPVRGKDNKIADVPPHKAAEFEKALDKSDAFNKEEVEADDLVKQPERPVAPPDPAKVEQQVHQVHEPPAPAPTEETVAKVTPPASKAEEPAGPIEHEPRFTNISELKPGDRVQYKDPNGPRDAPKRVGIIKEAKNVEGTQFAEKGDHKIQFVGEDKPEKLFFPDKVGIEKTGEGFPTDEAPKAEEPKAEVPAKSEVAPSNATLTSTEPRKIENPHEEGTAHFATFNSQSSKTFRETEGMLPATADAAAQQHEAHAANEVDEAQKVIHLGTAAGYLRRAKEERDWSTAAYRGPVSGHSIAGNPHPKDSKEHDAFRQNFIVARRHSRYDELTAEDAQNQVDHQTGLLNGMASRNSVDRAKVEGKIQGYQAHIEQLNNPTKAFSSANVTTDAKANAFADVKPDKPSADLSAPYAKPEHVDLENSVLESSLRHLSTGNVTPQDLRNEARQDAEQSANTASRGYDGEPLRATANGKLKAAEQFESGGGKAVPREGGTNKPPTEHIMMSHLQPGDRIWHNGESQFVHSNVKEPGKLRQMETVSERTGEISNHTHSGNTWFERLPATVKQPEVHGAAPRLEDGQLELPQQAVAPVGHLHGSSDADLSSAHAQGAADAHDELSELNPSRDEASAHAASLRDEIKGRPQTQAEEQDHAYKTGVAETYEAHAAKPPTIAATAAGEEHASAPKGDEPVPSAVQPGHEEAYRQGIQEGYAHGTDMHTNQGKTAAQIKALASNTYFKQAKKSFDEGDFSSHAQKYGFARGLGRAASEKRAGEKAPSAEAVASGAEEGPATDLGSKPVNNAEATISPSVVKEAASAPVPPPSTSGSAMESAVSRATDEGLKYNDIRDSAARAGGAKSRAENTNIVREFNAEAQKALADGNYSHAAWLDAHAKGYQQALGG